MTRSFIKAVREQFEKGLSVTISYEKRQSIIKQFDGAVLEVAHRFAQNPIAEDERYREAPVLR